MLEHGDGIPKTPLIWVHALMCLVLLFYLSAPRSAFNLDSHQSKILRKLQQFGVHPDTLHYSLFEKPNSVYCIFQVDFGSAAFVLAILNHHRCCISAAQPLALPPTFEPYGSVQKTPTNRVRRCRIVTSVLVVEP